MLQEKLDKFANFYGLKSSRKRASHKIVIIKWANYKQLPAHLIKKLKLPVTGWKIIQYPSTKPSMHAWSHPQENTVLLAIKRLDPIDISWAMQYVFTVLLGRGGFPLHAALLVKGRQAVLISAPGETGKTTCCKNAQPPWSPKCDENVLVAFDRGKYRALPLPTLIRPSKFIKICRDNPGPFNVAGVFFLEQSTRDSFDPLPVSQATVLLYQQITFSAGGKLLFPRFPSRRQIEETKMKNAEALAKMVPCFILRAKLNGNFQKSIGQALRSSQSPRKAALKIQPYHPKLSVAPHP